MILINVIVAKRVNEIPDLKIADMRDQMRQQRIRADIERHAKKRIGRSLIKLTMKNWGSSPTNRGPHVSISRGGVDSEGVSRFFDFELEQNRTRRRIDVVAFARIPTADDQATRI